MDDQTFEALQEGKEGFCELGAAELLLPMPLFAPLATREQLTFQLARQVARQCGVSLTATLWRILETGLVNALFIVWSFKHSPREFVPSSVGQRNLFGPADLMDPPRKMRVDRVFRPPQFKGFVPKDKSVPLDGVIHRAYQEGVLADGWEELELGPVRGLYFVEALPVSAGPETKVLTLVYLDEAHP